MQPEEALQSLSKIDKHDEFSLCSLALAYYHIKNYDKCDKALGQAVELVSSEEIRSYITAARAIVVKHKKGLKEMKLFLESGQSELGFEGLQMLCALGILEKDAESAQETLGAVKAFGNHPRHQLPALFLAWCFYASQGRREESKRQLCRAMFQFPGQYQSWIYSARHWLAESNSHTCLKLVEAGQKASGGAPLGSPLVVLCHLAAGNVHSALKESQKLLHLNPGLSSHWILLLTSCYGAGTYPNLDHLFKSVGTFVADNDTGAPVVLYFGLLRVIHLMRLNDLSQAQSALNQLIADCPVPDGPLSPAINCLRILCYQEISTDTANFIPFAWGITEMARRQSELGRDDQAVQLLQGAILHPNISRGCKLSLYMQLLLTSYKKLKEGADLDKYTSLCRDCFRNVQQLRPDCPMVDVLRAAVDRLAPRP